jgi:alkylation response protein AidB-like acyl-CoA dehydrogenase
VLGAALPEEYDGAGLGFLELHHVLAELGAMAAQVPLWESVVLGGLTIARHGTDAQREALLPGVAAGSTLLTAALQEPGVADPSVPRTRAVREDGRWRVTGVKTQVTGAATAHRVLVPATIEGACTVLLSVDPRAAGVTLDPQATVALRPAARVILDGALVADADVVGGAGDDSAVPDLLRHATAALASQASGICVSALRIAAEHTTEREQFGQPIATFQAVRQRLADAYIDVEAMRLTSVRAAWLLAEGAEAAETAEAVAVAKYWAAEGVHRVLHTAQHVHGGMGIDLDYHLHRYYRMGKWTELTLGHATHHLLALGRTMASADLTA